ncbi:pyruvate dehydrogenase (acetyl-transferring) E1 component subunit alpha [Pseudomonas sp. PDM14]|uniref:pyruvate dehydrogenase (acetyl-transferring) E1 component subunit alpha n=1 Tax=Pseudomonas sp. PDM14 TaxID=2769288 RepID=UPI0017866F23|nr:pyruvate dehydrogenase (acetyl-transferring) E1 component subunit alpha [Pseudomonas sp. PDM14]MBD9485128.1 pyruvate dehydrogenase (acetyl-transferring) E1 component subunit alpha [Pseudomonas sp. PDM14]
MTHNKIDLPYTRYLAPDGRLTGELPAWADDFNLLTRLYRQMVLTRLFDQKAVALQRTGRIGTYAPTLGQEAIGVAIGSLMRGDDVLVPYYRDTAVQLMRGVRMEEILLYWGGDERGSVYVDPAVAEDFPLCVPIATQSLHACGVATAFKIRGEHRATVTTCGDGATSKGDFLEALNVAGAWQLPVVFVVNNNQWAISTPRRIQSGAPSLAQKAIGAGFHGEQVDGNDILAVYDRMQVALDRARQGKGPVLLECLSYRLGDHTTADDATRYRSADEVKKAWEEEPIKRMQTFLASQGVWDEGREQALIGECQALVQQAVDNFESAGNQPVESIIDHVYAQWPAVLADQREALLERAARREGGAGHE